jgi:hypothetical protein
MIAANLLVGIILLVEALGGNGLLYPFVLPAMYLTYAADAFVRRQARRKELVRFEHTILGELDKAIWQVDHHVKQVRSMMLWYVLPLMLVFAVILFLSHKPLWALAIALFMIPASALGNRWEIDRLYLPKKHDLEALRDELIASQLQP